MEAEINYTKSAQENAEEYFGKAKEAKKKLAGAGLAIKRLDEKLAALGKKTTAHKKLTIRREREWYEKFYWFFTSKGMLAIGGRSAQQNEIVNAKHFEQNDLFFHANVFGASVVILKEGTKASREEREEVAQFAACYSKAWENGSAAADVFAARKEQVTKSKEKGYLPTGSFLISGEREWFRNVGLELVAYVSKVKTAEKSLGESVIEEVSRLNVVPAKTAAKIEVGSAIELRPGKLKKSDVAKLITKRFDYTEFDYIIQHLPPGLSSVSKG